MLSSTSDDVPGSEAYQLTESHQETTIPAARKEVNVHKCWKITAIIFIIVAFSLAVAIIALLVTTLSSVGDTGSQVEVDVDEDYLMKCQNKIPISNEKMLEREAFFSGLTPEETDQVITFMMSQTELQLTKASEAELGDNYIYSIQDELPSKSDMLKWLDGSNQTTPERKAKVLLFMGKKKAVEEYIVAPIPNPQRKTQRPNPGTWQARPICYNIEYAAVYTYVMEQLETISDIYKPSFTASCSDIPSCIFIETAPRVVNDSSNRHLVIWFYVSPFKITDYYLYPLPFYLVLKAMDNGIDYHIVKVNYNGNKFDSLNDLKDEYLKNETIRYKLPDLDKQRTEYGFPERATEGDTVDRTRRPPISYHPDGPRVAVTGSAVEWLGWSFYIHPRIISGIQLFNIAYNGKTIAYELSMQDVLVIYSDGAPDDYFRSFFDNGWSIGTLSTPLIRGVDCPIDAVYMSSNVYDVSNDEGLTLNDTICIFEHRNSVPLRRHYSPTNLDETYRFAFSMPDTVLIVRQIITVWNYDYIFDYEFHQNGVIELKASSTGYVLVTNNLDGSTVTHGYVINDHWKATANLHQHIFNFRMDFDIGGIKNNFKSIDMTSQLDTNNEFAAGETWYQIAMKETAIDNERDAAIRYSFEKPKQYIVSDDKQKGYRIQSNNFHHTTFPDDAPLLKGGASWVKYQLAVTKFDENEKTTASEFVQGDPFNPAVNFDDFIENNDNLKDEDLVVWVTVGLHHVPTYEDLPVTTTPGKTLSVTLAPFNYYKRDPSIASHDAAVFWHELVPIEDNYLYQNATCLPLNEKPEVL